MKKRIVCLLLALVMFAALPVMGASVFADGDYIEYTVGAETMKIICEKQGLDYDFCKAAIIKLNDKFTTEADFTTMTYGMTIKLPKTNADAAAIRGVALPDSLKTTGSTGSGTGSTGSASGEYIEYKIKAGDTAISICNAMKLDFGKCKAAIMKLNNFASDYSFLTLKAGNILKLPKSNADAASIVSTATGTGATTGTATGADYVAAYMVPYTVKAGETLYGICAANGIDFARYKDLIVKASGLKSADWIHLGDVLYLPSKNSAGAAFSVVAHTVKAGETTFGIAQALGINYSDNADMIAALNPGKNLSSIRLGDLLLFPQGKAVKAAAGTTSTATGAASGYTPAAAASGTAATTTPTVSTTAFKPKEGVNFYLNEIVVKKDDTVYNLVTARGFEYTAYYADVLLAANKLGSFNNLREGDKLLMLSNSATGAKIAVTGVTVKSGDTTIEICKANKVDYGANENLLARLNPNLNLSNIRLGDIVLLPIAK